MYVLHGSPPTPLRVPGGKDQLCMVPRKVAADPFSIGELQQFSRLMACFYPWMCCRERKRLASERQVFLQANCFPSTSLLLQCVNSAGKSSVRKLSVGAENMSRVLPTALGSNRSC